MEEKTIVVGKPSVTLMPIIGTAIGILLLVLNFSGVFGGSYRYNSHYERIGFTPPIAITLVGAFFIVASIVLFLYARNCEIQVTEKRVFGKAAFGKRVDIPVDSISAVGTIGILKGISVASAAGAIQFLYLANVDEVHNALSKLVVERQGKQPTMTIKQEIPQSNADELAKYKDLLDKGIISQEEFAAKKKQLLGL